MAQSVETSGTFVVGRHRGSLGSARLHTGRVEEAVQDSVAERRSSCANAHRSGIQVMANVATCRYSCGQKFIVKRKNAKNNNNNNNRLF